MRIQGTPVASGNVAPGKEQPGGRTWRWRGKPPGWPFDPATHEDTGMQPRNAFRSQHGRAERHRIYDEARDAGQDEAQAAQAAGIALSTGRDYEREYQQAKKKAAS